MPHFLSSQLYLAMTPSLTLQSMNLVCMAPTTLQGDEASGQTKAGSSDENQDKGNIENYGKNYDKGCDKENIKDYVKATTIC